MQGTRKQLSDVSVGAQPHSSSIRTIRDIEYGQQPLCSRLGYSYPSMYSSGGAWFADQPGSAHCRIQYLHSYPPSPHCRYWIGRERRRDLPGCEHCLLPAISRGIHTQTCHERNKREIEFPDNELFDIPIDVKPSLYLSTAIKRANHMPRLGMCRLGRFI